MSIIRVCFSESNCPSSTRNQISQGNPALIEDVVISLRETDDDTMFDGTWEVEISGYKKLLDLKGNRFTDITDVSKDLDMAGSFAGKRVRESLDMISAEYVFEVRDMALPYTELEKVYQCTKTQSLLE